MDAPTQAATKEKSKYLTIEKKLEGMKAGSIKGLGTKDVNTLNEPRAETEIITKTNQFKKIGDLYNKIKSEKKRIKDLLK